MTTLQNMKLMKYTESRELLGIVFVHSASLLILRGVERWLLEVTSRLSARRFKVSIITCSSRLQEYRSANLLERCRFIQEKLSNLSNVTWYELSVLSYAQVPKSLPTLVRFLKHSGIVLPISIREMLHSVHTVKNSRLIYIVIGDAFQALIFCLQMLLLGGKKIVFGLHSRPSYKRFLYIRRLLEALSMLGILKGIHSVNQADALTLRRMLKRVNVLYIPNGVDCERFRPDAGKKGDDVFQVLFVGALSEDKGGDIILQVGKKLRTEYPTASIKMVVASVGGPLEDEFQDAAKKRFLEYRGYISDRELARLYAESHAVLLPSRDEAFSLTALEAQACGTPVVCSDIIAYRQSVINGLTGFLVSDHSKSQSFLITILRLYNLWANSKEIYQLMCLNTRRHVQEKFCWEKVMNNLTTLFCPR